MAVRLVRLVVRSDEVQRTDEYVDENLRGVDLNSRKVGRSQDERDGAGELESDEDFKSEVI